MIYVGVMSANKNKTLWGPDAYEWRPERWLEPLPESLLNAKMPGVYSNLFVSRGPMFPHLEYSLTVSNSMTFWGGGRACM